MTPSDANSPGRVRREPPRLRTVTVDSLTPLSPYMIRATVTGAELSGFEQPEPAASVRLLVPGPGTSELVIPEWNGNEFLLPGGERPTIRTFTPRRFDPGSLELDLDIVLHEGGAISAWALAAGPGDPVAVSGPGRGYQIDPDARSFFLAGDETAIPAIDQLLEEMRPDAAVRVIIEIAHPAARRRLPVPSGADIAWVERTPDTLPGSALVAAVGDVTVEPGTRVWVAGEAGSLVAIRRHLFDALGLERPNVTVRGYWKYGR
ncbi:MAG: siderophore-interacting protein [Acidimicrobiia bacterium]|nr:siderophore-interacting protein [Acidimicrobiia bacterium]